MNCKGNYFDSIFDKLMPTSAYWALVFTERETVWDCMLMQLNYYQDCKLSR